MKRSLPLSRLASLALLVLLTSVVLMAPSADAADYHGSVGRLEAVFSLEWHGDGSVTGVYSYPSRPGVTYTLRGSNPAEGELHLEEYTGGILSARCVLHKRIEEGRIVWEGRMVNTDGRTFAMAFARPRAVAPAPVVDDYEARRRALLARIPHEVRWDGFPLADEVTEFVPAHLDEGEFFGAIVLSCENDETGTSLVLRVAEWDAEGTLRVEQGRDLRLRSARALPFPDGALAGREIALLFDPDGTLFSLEFAEIALTHVRRSPSGKFEVRGLVELFTAEESMHWSHETYLEKMRAAPVLEFLPDKLALDFDPSLDPDFADDGIYLQTIRLVRDYGLAVQATAAGPGALELESLSLDDEPGSDPWIPLQGLEEALKAPPTQFTGQAG